MPISSKTFNASNSFSNPQVLDFFMENKDKAYSLTELKKQFGANVGSELLILAIQGHLHVKYIQNDYYYQLKVKK